MNEKYYKSNKHELGIIALESGRKLAEKINEYLMGYAEKVCQDKIQSFIIPIDEVRFSNGDGKVVLKDSVRGKEIFIISDVGNHSCTYKMFGHINHKSPDDHFQDIKRVLSAISGKAKKITVIMPMLYASRQHRRRGRESLDCAMALKELENMGVNGIITFDTHDPNVQNAIPLISFDNLYPTYEIIKKIIQEDRDIVKNKSDMLVISPDTGAMDRAIYYSSILGLDVGLFYKRRDYSIIVNGKNPIVKHEYLGGDLTGKNILIIDDMIASGESLIDTAKQLREHQVNKIFIATTFALFTEGIERFNEYVNRGLIDKVYSTNLTYIPEEVRQCDWFKEVDLSEFMAKIIDSIHMGKSIVPILDGSEIISQIWNNKQPNE